MSAARIHQTKRLRLSLPASLAALTLFFGGRVQAAELAGATLETASAPGAEGCPGAEALKARTLELGRPRERPPEPLAVRVEYRRETGGFAATVRTSGARRGARELSAPGETCEPLATATSVVLAVLLDLLPPGASEKPLPARATPHPSGPNAPLVRYLAVGARFGAEYGLLGPALGARFGADIRLRLSLVELEAGGFLLPTRSASVPPGTVSAELAAGSAGACLFPWPGSRAFELGGCASLLVGRVAAAGHGFYRDHEVAEPWLAGRVGATFLVPLARYVAIRAGLDLMVPLVRLSLVVDRVGTAYEASPVGGALSFGPELRFR